MKLGCATWSFSKPHYQPPYDEAIRKIHEMGFQGIEMIAFEEKDLYEYYTEENIKYLRELYESLGLELTEFAVYTPVIAGLASLDEDEKEKAFEIFKKATDVAEKLGSRAMNLVSNWPETKCPIDYPPSYFLPFVNGVNRATPKLYMEIPTYDYVELWKSYVGMLGRCLEYVEAAGMEFYMEGHANVIVGNTDAMLRLFDNLPSEGFGVNFDTAWHLIQREYLPMSLRKLGKRVKHLHMRDGDGMFNYNLPCGMGIIDWVELIKTLNDIGFDGYMSFEVGAYDDMEKYIRIAKEYIDRAIEEAEEVGGKL